MIIMRIKISQLTAISLLLLVGCSGKPNNTNDPNSTGSSSTPASNVPSDQFPSYQNPTGQNKSKNLAPIPEMAQNVVNAALVQSGWILEVLLSKGYRICEENCGCRLVESILINYF